jgi:plasmid stabilization system protein ParE
MIYEIVLTLKAQEQLEATHDWWARHRSGEQAASWYNGFADAIVKLAENPQRWPRSTEARAFPYEIRELHFGLHDRPTHRAVFTIRERLIVVLAIRHLAQSAITADDV